MRFDQDDAAGLTAERVFDDHLLEKFCLLAEAAEHELTMTAPALACERCCAESVLDCLCGCECRSSFAQPISASRQLCDFCVELKASKDCAARRAQHDKAIKLLLQNFSDAIHETLQQLPDREVKPSLSSNQRTAIVQAVPRIIVRYDTTAYAIHSLEELSTLKQQAKHNASKATGLSSLSIHLILNGKPVYDEEAIFDKSGTISSFDTYTLQVALLGGSGNGADEDPRARNRKERRPNY